MSRSDDLSPVVAEHPRSEKYNVVTVSSVISQASAVGMGKLK